MKINDYSHVLRLVHFLCKLEIIPVTEWTKVIDYVNETFRKEFEVKDDQACKKSNPK